MQTSCVSTRFEDHMNELRAMLRNMRTLSLLDIEGVEEARIDIFVLETDDREIKLTIARDELAILNGWGLTLDCTFGSLQLGEP